MKIVDTNVIKRNVQRITNKHELCAVLKNDAYGLGVVAMATLLIKSGIRKFAVIELEEAIMLRDLSKKIEILLLGLIPYSDLDIVKENDITVSINSLSDKVPEGIKYAYKVNSSLNRFGIDIDDVPSNAKMVYSHLATDDVIVANNFLRKFPNGSIGSSKLLVGKNVRVGFEIFNNAVQILEQIVYTREVEKNCYVGYDYLTEKDMVVGIIPIGYYNGLIKANKGRMVYIRGKYYPILTICMNHTFIEIDECIKVGDDVEVYGNHITIKDVADYLQTSPYEVLVGMHKISRKYL